ncbi:MAG TPA: hypothetical protein VNK91_05005, partial [Burkholderiaceae bacterium]|nr:hypothetical protein [Burkholderiaceae bacterium]
GGLAWCRAPGPGRRPQSRGRPTALAAALLGLTAVAARACEPGLGGEGVRRLEGKSYVLAWRAEPSQLKVSEFFALEVAACARAGGHPRQLRVDAQMPEHRHGMNYRPSVASRGDGRFTATGLLLHMPGRWEFVFDLRGPAGAETLRERVLLR